MSAHPTVGPAVGVAAIFGVVVAALLPGRVILRADDFGYVESVVATLQHSRWMPSDWLEPFNVPLPLLSAGMHAATGNFWLATLGVSAALAITNLILLRAWLRPADAAGEWAVLAIALFPVGLNKTVEFTGVPLGIALLLGALLAWRRGSRGWFFALVLLGVANRQSAVCLLALPAIALVRTGRRERRVDAVLLTGIGVVAGTALAMVLLLPATFARAVAAARWREEFSAMALLGNLALGAVMLAALRAGWAAWRGESLRAVCRENLARPALPLVFTLAGAWVVLGGGAELRCELPGAANVGPAFVVVATFFGAWFGRWRAWPPAEAGAFVVVYAALVAWRGQWWDYYFLEPALVLAWPAAAVTSDTGKRRPGWFAWTLLAASLGYAVALSGFLRRAEDKAVAYENALRVGTLSIREASDAPFGFLGWKLFAASRARGLEGARLADFLKYVEGGRAHWSAGALSVNRDGARRSLHPSGEKWALPADWRDRRLPLTNAEWRVWLADGRAK